jgi:D-inositol-3-phosphate glycosyltransferase
LEAQASGCIPLVSEASGSPARHGVEGLVHRVGDVDALTAHLVTIADPILRAELRTRCVASRPSLTWRASGERLLAAYVAGLARRRGRRR